MRLFMLGIILIITWIGTLLVNVLFPFMWILPVIGVVAFLTVMGGSTIRDLEWFPVIVIAGGFMIFLTTAMLVASPDLQAHTLGQQIRSLGLILFFVIIGIVVACFSLAQTDWGRRWQGQVTVRDLISIAADPTNPDRVYAVLRLGGFDDRAGQEAVIQAIHDADPVVHDAAMLTLLDSTQPGMRQRALAAAEEPRVPAHPNQVFTPITIWFDLLLSYVNDTPDSETYAYALQAFLNLGAKAVPELTACLEPEEEPFSPNTVDTLGLSSRMWAAHVLGQLGAPALPAVPALIRALNDPARRTRLEVIEALGRLGDAQAVLPLIEQIQDADPEVRAAVAEALGLLGDARAIPALESMQQHDRAVDVERHPLKAIATEALANINSSAG
jgi:HEAT repeat protein